MTLLQCPLPLEGRDAVKLAHGGGGRLMHNLVDLMSRHLPGAPSNHLRHDAAVLRLGTQRVAFTTDSYVVQPRFFPGGDIGKLAVNGTINDLAMAGARPLYLSCAVIIEEGLPVAELDAIMESIGRAAACGGVDVVTGDTKVVERGKCDGLFVNTAGIGSIDHDLKIGPASLAPGDVIILSGDVGRHSIAVMGARDGFEFERPVMSDSAPLHRVVQALLDSGVDVHCLRDVTRGGLATCLVELAEARNVGIQVRESALPVLPEVRGTCEILGLDPWYLANEGRFICCVAASEAEMALEIMRAQEVAAGAVIIGNVVEDAPNIVTLHGPLGTARVLPMLSGEQLPRIC